MVRVRIVVHKKGMVEQRRKVIWGSSVKDKRKNILGPGSSKGWHIKAIFGRVQELNNNPETLLWGSRLYLCSWIKISREDKKEPVRTNLSSAAL